jgi:glycosyltransferase involved in cell wall biosynthesis
VDVLVMNGRDSRWSYLRGLFHLWRALSRRTYDLIHAHYVLTGVVARLQWGTPVVLTHHGCEVLGYPRWQTWLAKAVNPLFDEVIYRSEEMRRALNDEDGWILPAGIDLDRFTPVPRDEARDTLGLPLDRPLVLWAGEPWRPEKRFGLAAEAVELVKLDLPDAELVVLNKKPHDVVCNLPVVSVQVGDVPEVIAGTDGCTLAERDPADLARKLVEVLRHPRRTDGRRQVQRFSHERIAAGIVRAYTRAADRANRTRGRHADA